MNGAHATTHERNRCFGTRNMASNALERIRPTLLEENAGIPTSSGSVKVSFSTSSLVNSNEKISTGEEPHVRFSKVVAKLYKSGFDSLPKVRAGPIRSHPFDYNNLMKAFSHIGDVDEVLRLFREMKESKCNPNVLCYNTVINALVVANRHEEAEAVFEEMILSGVVPNVSSYNILIKMHSCYLEQFDLAYEVIRRMLKCGYSPDVTTYSTLIMGLCRAGRIREAWGVLDEMLEEKCLPNVRTYTPIVQGYCYEGRIEEAKRLLDTMERIGCPPNTVTYNILIDALCKIGNFDEIEKVIKESNLKSWKPNVITYNTYMDGLCKRGKAEEAFEKLEVMLANGLYPTVVTLNILLDCLCHSSRVWEAKCLLERSSELEWDVGVVGYNTVMSRLCEIGRWVAVLKLLIDMLKKGISPDTRSFNIVIHSLCKAGELRKAKCIINSRGFVANVVTYNTLIHGFYLAGKIYEVQLLFAKMVVEKIAPDIITYTIVIDGLCRQGKFLEASDCILRSRESGFFPDLVVDQIYRLVKSRKLRELLNMFEGMLVRGFVPDVRIFDSLIKAFCREDFCQSTEIFKVCIILDKMLGRI